MRNKILVTVTALAGVALGATLAHAAAGSNGGGLVGSKHDMNAYMSLPGIGGTKDSMGRVCAYCHTPHHAESPDGTIYTPLWSREASMPEGMDTYAEYKSQTFNVTADDADPLIGPSRLCLACHDGTVGADAYYGKATGTADTGNDLFTGGTGKHIAVAAKDGLANDHPIGFDYEKARLGTIGTNGGPKELKLTSTALLGGQSGKTIKDLLWNDPDNASHTNIVTCASCHDVHNGPMVVVEKNISAPDGTANTGYFLIGKQKDSQICLTCHDKNS